MDVRLTAYASTILAGVQVFFLLLLNFAAPPFALVQGAAPADGFGLNSIRERAITLGGSLTVRQPGAGGTELEVVLP